MALNGLFCADVPLRNYSLIHSPALCINIQTKSAAVTRVDAFYLLYRKFSVQMPVAKRNHFPGVPAVLYTLWWRCYIEIRTLQSTLGYDTVIRRT